MKQIYLMCSNSYHLLKNELDKILKDHNNITTNSLNDMSIYDIIDDASYFGMFEDDRVVIIKDCKYFGGKYLYEEECDALFKFLSNIQDITIIVICDEIKKSKDITKKVISLGANIIDLSNQDENELLKYINEYCKNNQINIDENNIKLLMKNSLNNLDIVIQEINKLSMYNRNITKEIIELCGPKYEEDETFSFSNAVVSKNIGLSFEILDRLLNNGVEVISLIGLLANSYSNMYMVKEASSKNISDEDIAKMFGYSSTGRVYIMKKNAKIYTLEEIKDIIISLSLLDKKIKTGLNPVYGIKEFLLSL